MEDTRSPRVGEPGRATGAPSVGVRAREPPLELRGRLDGERRLPRGLQQRLVTGDQDLYSAAPSQDQELLVIRISAAREIARLRVEMHTDLVYGLAGVREELRNGQAALRDEIRIARGDFLSWSFRLWTEQLVLVLAVLAFVMR